MEKITISEIQSDLTKLYYQPTEDAFYHQLTLFQEKHSKYKDFLCYFNNIYINHSRFIIVF